MSSLLEKIPQDIIQHIAFLVATTSIAGTNDLFRFFSTSSTVYKAISVTNCPHLYADIFRSTFDIPSPNFVCASEITDSGLALEFMRRCRVLRRARRCDISSFRLRQDLWTALWMILEYDGQVETEILMPGFLHFIVSLLSLPSSLELDDLEFEIGSLAVCLLSHAITREYIQNLDPKIRADLIKYIAPFTAIQNRTSPFYLPKICKRNLPTADKFPQLAWTNSHSDNTVQNSMGHVLRYLGERDIPPPNPVYAAVNVVFALKDCDLVIPPPYLLESRVITPLAQRSGPTLEDFRKFASHRTSLFADVHHVTRRSYPNNGPPSYPLTNIQYNLGIYSALWESSADLGRKPYAPGSLAGVWQGSWMILETEASPITNLGCRMPMQCSLSEYICYSPHVSKTLDSITLGNSLCPDHFLELKDALYNSSECYDYEKCVPTSSYSAIEQNRDLDIILKGETLEDHDEAWGGFRFTGRIRRDGLIVLKREPKSPGQGLGTWIFEGLIHSGGSFVGQWRSDCESADFRGIFNMEKQR